MTIGISELQGTDLTAGQNVLNVMRNVGIIIGMALFLSMLSGNITDAKSQTYDYAVGQINKIDVATSSKTTFKNKLHEKLVSGNSNNVNTSNKVKSSTINSTKRNELINVEYTKIVAQKQTELGVAMPETVTTTIKQQVTKAINKKINTLNSQITHATKNIKNHLQNKLTNSFLNLYTLEYPLILISLITVFIFKRKNS
ncbi:hypothetical protein [Companilactobacillus jidongensis]|uniref:hypothetical protein n=1 Tax=Companilactobacillus jidongensis TaxID=2486006 RepID=UPI0013DE6129|nr:hypothetical protein [Companilactobacillus jidongensis]